MDQAVSVGIPKPSASGLRKIRGNAAVVKRRSELSADAWKHPNKRKGGKHMTVSVKSLQKQLIAAVAMVLVAMIALGSSTYAWFVSNNQVTATTSSISAQSMDSRAVRRC